MKGQRSTALKMSKTLVLLCLFEYKYIVQLSIKQNKANKDFVKSLFKKKKNKQKQTAVYNTLYFAVQLRHMQREVSIFNFTA